MFLEMNWNALRTEKPKGEEPFNILPDRYFCPGNYMPDLGKQEILKALRPGDGAAGMFTHL